MSLRIRHNIEAFNAHRQLAATSDRAAQVHGAPVLRLPHQPCGRRRRRPRHQREAARSDRWPLAGPAQRAGRRLLVQTAEGSLNEVHSMLQRVRELAVQYKNGTLSTSDKRGDHRRGHASSRRDRAHRHDAAVQRHQAARRHRRADHVPGRRQRRRVHHGHDLDPRRRASARSTSDLPAAGRDIADIDAAIDERVDDARATFGAVQNRLEHTLNNLATYQENLMRPRAGSATWTWPRRWSSSPSTRSCSRPARACSRRPTRPRRRPVAAPLGTTWPDP